MSGGPADLLSVGRQVIREEAEALFRLGEALGAEFESAVEVLRGSRLIILSGLGKSGLIARKIAATLTSTGSPAVDLHPVEALHGDLGIVDTSTCLVAISRSGNTEELLRFVMHFRRVGGPVIAVTQSPNSRLAEVSRHVLAMPDVPEAGPLGLAPTTSCVMTLALGDALAMALLKSRGFREEDFALFHPEGTLGRRLLLRASDLMHGGEQMPLVRADAPFTQLLLEMNAKRLGLALIVEPDGRLLGMFTDGDLRRLIDRVENLRSLDARAAHARSRRDPTAPPVRCSHIAADHLAVDCLRLMRESQITSLVVLDEADRPIGVLRLMDLVSAGIG